MGVDRGAELQATYELRVSDKEILNLPVRVVDVDDIHLWVQVERDPTTSWNVGLPWSKIVRLIDDSVWDKEEGLEEAYQGLKAEKKTLHNKESDA